MKELLESNQRQGGNFTPTRRAPTVPGPAVYNAPFANNSAPYPPPTSDSNLPYPIHPAGMPPGPGF